MVSLREQRERCSPSTGDNRTFCELKDEALGSVNEDDVAKTEVRAAPSGRDQRLWLITIHDQFARGGDVINPQQANWSCHDKILPWLVRPAERSHARQGDVVHQTTGRPNG